FVERVENLRVCLIALRHDVADAIRLLVVGLVGCCLEPGRVCRVHLFQRHPPILPCPCSPCLQVSCAVSTGRGSCTRDSSEEKEGVDGSWGLKDGGGGAAPAADPRFG